MPATHPLLLTPGAGAGRDHATLVALEEGLAPTPVGRMDFPYRKEGRKAPDREPKLIAAIVEEAAALAAKAGAEAGDLVLGGRSMGGRMCSMAIAGGLPAAGLVLLSYPLHPPGKPERLRIDHFSDIAAPCLFVSGARDQFGTPDEITEHSAAIAGAVTLHWLDGAGHDPRKHVDEIVSVVRDWLEATGLRP